MKWKIEKEEMNLLNTKERFMKLFRNNYERFYGRNFNDLLFDLCHEMLNKLLEIKYNLSFKNLSSNE